MAPTSSLYASPCFSPSQLACVDGCRLYANGNIIISNWTVSTTSGKPTYTTVSSYFNGLVHFRLEYFSFSGYPGISVNWTGPGMPSTYFAPSTSADCSWCASGQVQPIANGFSNCYDCPAGSFASILGYADSNSISRVHFCEAKPMENSLEFSIGFALQKWPLDIQVSLLLPVINSSIFHLLFLLCTEFLCSFLWIFHHFSPFAYKFSIVVPTSAMHVQAVHPTRMVRIPSLLIFPVPGEPSCNTCPPSYTHVNSTTCSFCDAGLISTSSSAPCSTCSAGYWADNGFPKFDHCSTSFNGGPSGDIASMIGNSSYIQLFTYLSSPFTLTFWFYYSITDPSDLEYVKNKVKYNGFVSMKKQAFHFIFRNYNSFHQLYMMFMYFSLYMSILDLQSDACELSIQVQHGQVYLDNALTYYTVAPNDWTHIAIAIQGNSSSLYIVRKRTDSNWNTEFPDMLTPVERSSCSSRWIHSMLSLRY